MEKNDEITIVFGYLKQLLDINPPLKLYWKEQSRNIWENNNIKQWLVYGSDLDIDQLWVNLQGNTPINIGGRSLTFNVPSIVENIGEANTGNIISISGETYIPPMLQIEENLAFLEGWQLDDSGKIKAVSPPGIFEKGFLEKTLLNNNLFYKDFRSVYYSFRGEDKDPNTNSPNKMIGFVQGDFKTNSFEVEFWDENGIKLGTSKVDPETGIFDASLNSPVFKGKFILTQNTRQIEEYNYVLLRGFKLGSNFEVKDDHLLDLFGRSISVKNKVTNPTSPKEYTWHKELFHIPNDSLLDLTDYLKDVLSFLGPHILICDPYFLGNLPPNTEEEINSYKIFVNAIISAAVQLNNPKFHFMGYWGRANSIIKSTDRIISKGSTTEGSAKTNYFSRFKESFESIILQDNLSEYLPLKNIKLINTSLEFHNRYWFGLVEKNGKMIIDQNKIFLVTNSINGVCSSGEIDFMQCDNPKQIQRIATKYDKLVESSSEVFSLG